MSNTLLCSTSCEGDSFLEEVGTCEAREEPRTGSEEEELLAMAGTFLCITILGIIFQERFRFFVRAVLVRQFYLHLSELPPRVVHDYGMK